MHNAKKPFDITWLINEGLDENSMLLNDSCGSSVERLILEDSKIGNGLVKFRGKFQEANKENKNKRLYTFEALDSNRNRLQETIKARGLLGELDHPQDSIIHFEKASHLVTKLWWEGNILMGEAEILPTPMGMILRKFIESDVRVGISSRGVGNGRVNNEGILVIDESYKLITFDAVADPSTFSAYQKVVANTVKHEQETPKPVVTENPEKELVKNESSRIHTINPEALLAYLGQVIKTKFN